MITNQTMAEAKYQEAIQTWYEPALHLLNQMLETNRKNLRKRGHDESKAAIKIDDWKFAMQLRHNLSRQYIEDIQRSLFKAGRITYLGSYMTKTGGDV